MNRKGNKRSRFDARLEVYYDELRQLFMDLYHDEQAFEYFLDMLRKNFRERKKTLKDVDARRAAHPYMHHSNRMMGMMLYTENFGGNLNGSRAPRAAATAAMPWRISARCSRNWGPWKIWKSSRAHVTAEVSVCALISS